MWPVILKAGNLTVHTLGIFLVLMLWSIGFTIWARGRQEHYNEDELFDGFLLASIASLVVSRIVFILLHLDVFGNSVWSWFDLANYPGIHVLAGILIYPVVMAWHARTHKWNTLEVLDFLSIGLSTSLIIYWLGAFLDGSQIGLVTDLPWGVVFPGIYDARHPAQLYALAGNALVLLYLKWAESRFRLFNWYRHGRHSAPAGFIFCVWLIAQGIIQLLLLTVAQQGQFVIGELVLDILIYPLLILFGIWMLLQLSGRSFLVTGRKVHG